MSTNPLYIGLMSGTSLDGVDGVLTALDGGRERLGALGIEISDLLQ
jgi:1,6-anhydro-N-acetylmuramate kinase